VGDGHVLWPVAHAQRGEQARDAAYALCENIKFSGAQYRRDIAYQALRDKI